MRPGRRSTRLQNPRHLATRLIIGSPTSKGGGPPVDPLDSGLRRNDGARGNGGARGPLALRSRLVNGLVKHVHDRERKSSAPPPPKEVGHPSTHDRVLTHAVLMGGGPPGVESKFANFLRPAGAGGMTGHRHPRVPSARGGLHPWLRSVAPCGAKIYPSKLSRTRGLHPWLRSVAPRGQWVVTCEFVGMF